jgi:hypothetical protein
VKPLASALTDVGGIASSAGRITEILVGGRVVPAIEGRLRVP